MAGVPSISLMLNDDPLSRRDFARLAAGVALLPAFSLVSGRRQASGVSGWPGYDAAIVIDLLASVTPFNVPDMYARALTPEMIDNARLSGITAVNATCSASGVGPVSFIETVSNIAFWEREFDAHRDMLMKVKTHRRP